MNLQKQPRIKSKDITDSAKGENCTLRIYGVCNGDPSTTVFAHAKGGGMGMKAHDIHGCYACSGCHDWLDVRSGGAWVFNDEYRRSEFLRAMMETQTILFQKGLIRI